jgi:hypothetical protein
LNWTYSAGGRNIEWGRPTRREKNKLKLLLGKEVVRM